MRVILLSLLLLTSGAPRQATAPVPAAVSQGDESRLLIRCDDFGMCHAVNMAVLQLIKAEIPISVSVMFTCPWYQEAVEILRQHPEVSVGVHLTLNSEWEHYRWGPVLGATAVPSIVDSIGYFFPSRALLFANDPKTSENEKELRAQMERAKNTGLRLDYIDHHMGAAVQTEELRLLVESLAEEYGLGLSQYFDEYYSNSTYFPPVEDKTDSLIASLQKLKPGAINLQVFHVGLDTPEMSSLHDLNPGGLKNMSVNRQGELNALLSQDFKEALRAHNVRLVTYRDVVKNMGLKNMRRPGKKGYD